MKKKPTILIFSLMYEPFLGGAEVFIREFCKQLKNKYRFVIMTGRYQRNLKLVERKDYAEIRRAGVGIRFLDFFLYPFFVYRAARHIRADLVHNILENQSSFAGILYARSKSKPLLFNLQSGDSESYIYKRVWWCWPLYKKMYSAPDYIHSISRYLRDRARKWGARAPIEIIPNGVNLKHFNAKRLPATARAYLRKKLGIMPHDKVVVTSSRLALKNAVDDVIKAMLYLPADVKFLICGIGPDKQKLVKLVQKHNLGKRVIFAGQISHDKLPSYLKISDVFVRPSLSEGLGISFLESLACGLPIIATRVGGIPDFLKDRKTGLFCKVRDPKDLANKIQLLLTDKRLHTRISKNGVKLLHSYSWKAIASRIDRIYQKLLRRKR